MAHATALKRFGAGGMLALTLGDPDINPPREVVKTMSRVSADAGGYGYVLPAFGTRRLLTAGARFRQRVDGVALIPHTENSAVPGSRRGIWDVVFAITNHSDVVLMPSLGYQAYHHAVVVAGCTAAYYSVRPKIVDQFEEIVSAFGRCEKKPRLLIICSPGNPYGRILPEEFYPKLINFAANHDLVVLSDEAYQHSTFNGKKAWSLLQFEGGRAVGVSMWTLSKTHNLPGIRVAFVEGNPEIVEGVKQMTNSSDYGHLRAVQATAIEALKPEHDKFVVGNAEKYAERHEVVFRALRSQGVEVWESDGGIFVSVVILEHLRHLGSVEVCARLFEQTGLRLNPGASHGPEGDDILRLALVRDPPVLREACRRVAQFYAANTAVAAD